MKDENLRGFELLLSFVELDGGGSLKAATSGATNNSELFTRNSELFALKLVDLANEVNAVAATGRLDAEAVDVTHDSRQWAPGTAIIALRGAKVNARRFVPEA